jgi:hypothetical protein
MSSIGHTLESDFLTHIRDFLKVLSLLLLYQKSLLLADKSSNHYVIVLQIAFLFICGLTSQPDKIMYCSSVNKSGTVNPIHGIVQKEAKIHELLTFSSFYILKSIK